MQLPERYKEAKQKYERGNHVGCPFSSFCFEPVGHEESLTERRALHLERAPTLTLGDVGGYRVPSIIGDGTESALVSVPNWSIVAFW